MASPEVVGVEAQLVNRTLKTAFAAAAALAVAVAGIACGPGAVAPSPVISPPVISPPVIPPSAMVSPSPELSSSQQGGLMTVAGTELGSSALRLTVDLPPDWQAWTYGANRGTSLPPAGMAFVVSTVDNTFEDPCSHLERSPKVGPTVEDLATALGEVPNTTATDPVKTRVAGHEATYIELAIPASLPCAPDEFYLWQDSPNADWWVQGLNETARVWILEVGSQRVAFLTHSYPDSSKDAKAEFQKILDTVVFEGAS
jgi:hypothetical protein